MNWKLIAAVALMAVGLGAIGFVVIRPDLGSAPAAQYLTANVSQTDVLKTATASGALSATGTYGLSFGNDPAPISGTATTGGSTSAGGATAWLVKTVTATVGQKVSAGAVLATADPTDARLQVTIATANLAAAKARLTVDAGGPTALVLAAARQGVAQSQLAYTAAAHSRQSTLQQNADAVTQAKQALADARAQLASAKVGPTSDVVTAANDSLTQAQLSYQATVQSTNDQKAQDALTLSQAQATVAAAEDQLANAQAKAAADTDPSTGTVPPADTLAVTAAQNALTQAQASYTSASLRVRTTENQITTQLASAQQSLSSAQHQYASKVAPSQASVDSANQAVKQAELSLASAQLRQSTGVTQLADQLAQAQLSLASAQNGYQQKIQPAAADQIATDKASVATAQVNLTSAEQTLSRATLVAPSGGTVVSVNVVPGVEAPSGYAITMQSSTFQITANFAETDIPTLAVGQPADVTITATKETATGTVAQITPVAATAANSSVVTYAVIVVLDPTPAGAMSGMSANVSITTAQALGVLAVPSTALVGRGGTYTVRVIDGAGRVSSVPVVAGLVTSALAEIKSGVSAGQTVVTGTVSARQGTTTTGAGGGLGIPGLGGGGGGFPRNGGGGGG